MKKLAFFLSAVFCLMTCVAAYAQSLGDFAREEEKRRNAISEDKIIKLENQPPTVPEEEVLAGDENATDETENTQDAGMEENGEEPESSAEKADQDGSTAPDEKNEAYWRNEMTGIRSKLKQLEDEAKELSSKRSSLQSRHSKTNSALRGPIKDEIDKTRQAQELNRKKLEQTRNELKALQNAARSSGALPGWVE